MKKIILISTIFLSSCESEKDRIKKMVERAYFEGQRDALKGDVRIKRDEFHQCWRWSKSPWDNGDPALTDISGIKDK